MAVVERGEKVIEGVDDVRGTKTEGKLKGQRNSTAFRLRFMNIQLLPLPSCSRRRFLTFALFALLFIQTAGLLVINTACTGRHQPHRETRFMMGTLVEVVLYSDDRIAKEAASRVFARMNGIEAASHHSDVDGAVYRLSQGKGFRVEGDLFQILEKAMKVSRATSGAFDPTLGSLVYLWGFGREDPNLPDPSEIQAALEGVGWERVPRENCCPEGLKIWFDLGGVAKGYAVDEAVQILMEAGVGSGIVNAGGDLRSFGEGPRKGYWKIGVQDPNDPRELAGILYIRGAAVATSGDYQRYFEKDGIRYHHILDPDTGYPAQSGLKGTTVIAPDCATADALATAAFVLGPEKGLALLEDWSGAEGVLIAENGNILTTSGIGEGGVRFERQ